MTTPSPTIKALTVSARRSSLPVLRRVAPHRYSDAQPFRVIDIPTHRITHMQRRWDGPLRLPWLDGGRFAGQSSLRRRWHAGVVLDGDWDLTTDAFADYHLTRVLTARFRDGAAWRDIPYIRKAYRKVENGEPAWGGRCRTASDVRARCEYLDGLHARLAADGYWPDAADHGPLLFTHFLVNIGRDGTIIRNNDGKHRIILSQILGIPTLPARVLVRHLSWQTIRSAIRRGDTALAVRFRGHPDLDDLIP